MSDDKPTTTMEVRYRLGPDGVPFLLLDGVPVPKGATVTMPASAVAEFGYGCDLLGARAGMAGRPATLGDLDPGRDRRRHRHRRHRGHRAHRPAVGRPGRPRRPRVRERCPRPDCPDGRGAPR